MSYQLGLRNLIEQPVRHRVFVSYQHSRDQVYYDAFSQTFHDTHEAVLDNSLERRIDSDDVDYVIRRIREDYIRGTSCTIVLVGAETWGRKYVDWEVKATLDKQHGLIGVQLPTLPVHPLTNRVDVPIRLSENINSGYALWMHWDQLTASSLALNAHIAEAKSRPASLIRNTRDRRLRNA
jgi:MTH538 TIR-like domain (DUF1863)